jgi:glycine cleavage system H protein
MKFSESHEWAFLHNDIAICGITHYAQKELGEIVFVELPRVGSRIKAGQEAAVLESTKAACDIYSPLTGEVVEVNHHLKDYPEMINQFPGDKGWLFKLKVTSASEYQSLMSEDDYQRFVS